MGASSVVRAKSPSEQNDVEQQQHHEEHQPPQLNVQDIENNNDHIFVNPHERFLTFVDECDLLNNNTSLINSNYLTVTYTPTSINTTNTTALRFNNSSISDINRRNKQQLHQNQSALTTSNNRILSNNSGGDVISSSEKKKMQVRESPKKSPKKQNINEKIAKENEKKKKKKEKPKAPRAPSGGGNVGGRGRGMAEQDQLMRRPRRKLNSKAEKYEESFT